MEGGLVTSDKNGAIYEEVYIVYCLEYDFMPGIFVPIVFR